MDYIIYFAITIGILVFIHEFGHFAAAKLSGMRADVFAIGFGKRLFGWNRKSGFSFGELPKDFDGEGHTDYRLSLLPLGGYVKIAGMVDETMDTSFAESEPQPYEFSAKPLWAKVFVITAGVIMNLLLAWIIFWGANFFQGKPITPTTTLAYIEDGSAAAKSGFFSGDKILSVNNKDVTTWEDLRAEVFINTLGENINVKVLRDGKEETLSIDRKLIPDDETQGAYLIPEGVKPAIGEVVKDSPAEKSGIKTGDILIAIDDESLYSSQQATNIISQSKDKELKITVERNKETKDIFVTPGKMQKLEWQLLLCLWVNKNANLWGF